MIFFIEMQIQLLVLMIWTNLGIPNMNAYESFENCSIAQVYTYHYFL